MRKVICIMAKILIFITENTYIALSEFVPQTTFQGSHDTLYCGIFAKFNLENVLVYALHALSFI